MSTAQFTTPLIVTVPGQLIASSLWNNEFTNLFTNLNPLGIGAYSDTDPQMQTSTDPFPSGTSRPTSLGGEIERLRYILNLIIGQTYWYQHPSIDLETLNTDIGTINGRFPVQTVDIGDAQVTTAKIADLNVTTGKIANAAVTETQISTSIAGDGLVGGAGTPLAVNPDNSTLQINADAVRVKASGITSNELASNAVTTAKITDANVTAAKLASDVAAAAGLKSIQSFTVTTNFSNTQSNVTTNTTISSVNTAKAIAVITSITLTNNGGIAVTKYTVSLTTATNLATTITLAGGSSGVSSVTTLVTILEFN